jgi:CRP/FNR family transcriptional regulator, cyclic AMP receptor protein
MAKIAELSRTALKMHSVLGALPDAALDALAGHGWLTAFAPNAVLYKTGDASDRLLIVASGRIRLMKRLAPSRDVILRLVGPGDIDGDMAVLDGGPRTVDAVAVEPTEAIVLYRPDVLQALGQSPVAIASVISTLASKVRDLSADAELTALLVTGQVAHALLRLADQHGRPLPDGILIDLVLSPDDLVKHTGLAPEAARHRLGQLRDLGLIRPHGTRIVIVDRDALQDYAEVTGA